MTKIEQVFANLVKTKTRRGVPETVSETQYVHSWKLPNEWIKKSAGELLHLGVIRDLKDGNHGEIHPKKNEFSKEGVPFITAAQVNDFNIDYEGAYKLTGEPLKRLKIGFAKTDDVILTHKGSVGKVAIAKQDCVLSPQTTYYRLNPTILYNRFLMWFLASPFFTNQIKHIKKQTTREYLPITKQYTLFIILPPLDTQKKIVKKLDYIIGQLEEKKKIILELQKIKSQQSELLSDNFMSFLIADLIPTENYPSTWEPKTLGEIFEEVKNKWEPNSKPENLNYIGLENIEANTGKLVKFTPTDSLDIKSSKAYFSKNDVLYGKLRPYLNKVLLPTFDGVCSTDIIVLKPKPDITKEFLAFFLRSSHVLSKMSKLMYGTKMPRAKIQDLQDVKIGLPLKKVQLQIVKKLQDSEKIVDSLKQSVNKITVQQEELTKYLQYLQSSILDKAFTGKLVN